MFSHSSGSLIDAFPGISCREASFVPTDRALASGAFVLTLQVSFYFVIAFAFETRATFVSQAISGLVRFVIRSPIHIGALGVILPPVSILHGGVDLLRHSFSRKAARDRSRHQACDRSGRSRHGTNRCTCGSAPYDCTDARADGMRSWRSCYRVPVGVSFFLFDRIYVFFHMIASLMDVPTSSRWT